MRPSCFWRKTAQEKKSNCCILLNIILNASHIILFMTALYVYHLGGGSRLLEDELDDVIGRPAAVVVLRLAVLQELEGGEPAHAVLLPEILVRVAVNLPV